MVHLLKKTIYTTVVWGHSTEADVMDTYIFRYDLDVLEYGPPKLFGSIETAEGRRFPIFEMENEIMSANRRAIN